MDARETAQLVTLLKKLRTNDLLPPNMPYDVWKAIHQTVPIPTIEAIVTRDGKDFVLTYRKDNDWDGWHIPGSYMLYRESIEDGCKRIGKVELGIDITFDKFIGAYMWPDHPFSSALSLVCVCKTMQEPKEGQFFTEVPKDIIIHHGDFLEKFLEGKMIN